MDGMEKRHLLAFVLIAAILAFWSATMSKKQPRPDLERSGESTTAVEAPAPDVELSLDEEESGDEPSEIAVEPETEEVIERFEATVEESVVLENPQLRIELTNVGAAIRSLVLKGYQDDEGNALEMVQSVDHDEATLPLQLILGERIDSQRYVVEHIEGGRRFIWSDGSGRSIQKDVRIRDAGYGIEVTLEASGYGDDVHLTVGTGMRDRGPREQENRFSLWGHGIAFFGGEYERFKREKLRERQSLRPQNLAFAGFEDTYFLNVFRPRDGVEELVVQPLAMAGEEEEDDERVLQILLRLSAGEIEGELFSAPKEYDLLQRVGGGIEGTLDFGFFQPISVFFLRALQWTFGVVQNYGVAIILLTLAIRIVLFPLMHTSTVSMRKMQKLQPKVKAIQEKYKKNKTDPQVRAKMNQEMMELYKVEGVNPMSGCLPLLIQLPILWALYTLFAHAIELRHAPFIFWIQDLSAKDPYYITPVLMTATMWLQQRLAPQAGDPQQQRIFRMMPLIFGIMFLGFPSGLVLYWLTNNVLTIAQQELTLRLIGERGKGSKPTPKGKRRSSKK